MLYAACLTSWPQLIFEDSSLLSCHTVLKIAMKIMSILVASMTPNGAGWFSNNTPDYKHFIQFLVVVSATKYFFAFNLIFNA
jgi:hypothetical protein